MQQTQYSGCSGRGEPHEFGITEMLTLGVRVAHGRVDIGQAEDLENIFLAVRNDHAFVVPSSSRMRLRGAPQRQSPVKTHIPELSNFRPLGIDQS